MRGPRVKICGLTAPEDAAVAVSLGVDFGDHLPDPAASTRRGPRHPRRGPTALLVGVFANAVEDVIGALRGAELDLIQLHGEETPSACDELGRVPAVHRQGGQSNKVPGVANWRHTRRPSSSSSIRRRTLPTRGAAVGARRSCEKRRGRRQAAGGSSSRAGSNRKTRARLARATGAFGIDVRRGVERAPGVKDPRR